MGFDRPLPHQPGLHHLVRPPSGGIRLNNTGLFIVGGRRGSGVRNIYPRHKALVYLFLLSSRGNPIGSNQLPNKQKMN